MGSDGVEEGAAFGDGGLVEGAEVAQAVAGVQPGEGGGQGAAQPGLAVGLFLNGAEQGVAVKLA